AQHTHPDIMLTVFVQTIYGRTKTTVLSVAPNDLVANFAELSRGNSTSTSPHRALSILEEFINLLPRQFLVWSQLAVFPTHQTFRGPNPKRPVACSDQANNPIGGKRTRRLPGDRPHTVESNQAEFRSQPEITVFSLGDGYDGPFGKAVTNLPRRMRVLTDI